MWLGCAIGVHRKARAEILSGAVLLRRRLEYADMNDQSRRARRMLAVAGLIFVALSIAVTFVAPGTFWNWGLLLVALAFLLLSRRFA